MEDELAKLPPGDEVAIMAMNIGEDEGSVWLTEFTNDRAKLAAALARVPAMCEPESSLPSEANYKPEVEGEGKPDDIVQQKR